MEARLVECILVGRALAKEGHGDPVLFQLLCGQRSTACLGRGDDGVFLAQIYLTASLILPNPGKKCHGSTYHF